MATTIPVGTGRLILGNNLSEFGPSAILGTTSNDTIYGYAGNDSINGFAGNDYIDGGIGNDTLMGGPGADTLVGGAGDDFLDGSIGTDVIFGGSGFDTALYSSVAGFNTAAANSVEFPLLFLVGTAGADNLVGTPFNDTIVGGAGADTLTGGTGMDFFRFNNLGDAFDTITDFTPGQDKIQLSTAFNPTPGGIPTAYLSTSIPLELFTGGNNNTANLFIGAYPDLTGQNSGAGVIGGPIFVYSTAGSASPGLLLVDIDGRNFPATLQPLLTLTGAPALTLNDFVVV